jgi:L-cystine transport system permease protein
MDTRPFNPLVIFSVMPELLSFLWVTVLVAATSIIFGSLFGMVLAGAKLGKNPAGRWLAHGYTYIMRCTPSIVLLFIVFYGLPQMAEALTGYDINDMNRSVFAIITFSLLFSAYISEIFRAAYEAVPKGQYEAAVSIGLSPLQALRTVVLPQAAVIALPNFGNSVINLLKEGALAYTIGLIDMLGEGNLIIAQNYGAYGIEIYLACMIIYWGVTTLLGEGFLKLERWLDRSRNVQRQAQKTRPMAWSLVNTKNE